MPVRCHGRQNNKLIESTDSIALIPCWDTCYAIQNVRAIITPRSPSYVQLTCDQTLYTQLGMSMTHVIEALEPGIPRPAPAVPTTNCSTPIVRTPPRRKPTIVYADSQTQADCCLCWLPPRRKPTGIYADLQQPQTDCCLCWLPTKLPRLNSINGINMKNYIWAIAT